MKDFASTSSEIDISKSQSPHYIKFALLCLHKRNLPILCGYLCFVISQLQLLALFLKNTYVGFSDSTPSSSAAIKLFIKLFVVGDWVDQTDTTPILVGIIMSTVYILVVLCVFTYLNLSLHYRKTIPEGVQRLWAALHNYHPLVFFFWIHTFCLQIIRFSLKGDDFSTTKDRIITALAYVNLFFNWVFGIFFSMIYVTYKTKNPLACKTNALEIHTFLLKSVIPILWVFTENQEGLQMLIFTLSLLSTAFHDWIFYKYLPYYHIKLLELSLVFKGPQTALILSSFIIKAVAMSGTKVGLYEIQVIWLMLSPLLIKAHHHFLWKLLRWVFTCEPSDESNMYYLVHKRVILLYFYEERKILHEGVNDLAFLDLLYQGKLSHFVTQMKLSFSDLDRNKKILFNTLRFFYQRIIKQRPKSLLAKVDLAYFYSKLENLYLISNNLIEEIALQHPGYQAQISLSFIRFLLQRKLSLQFSEKTITNNSRGLNIDNYISNQDLKKKFKNAVEKQVKLQISFWKDFLVNKPDMLQLMKGASEVDEQKMIIKKLWGNLLRQRPYTFLSPLIVYGMYASLVNNDSGEGEKYIDQYHEDNKRFKKIMKVDELNNATVFCDKTIRLTMSGLKKNLGKILDCSSNITQSFGWNPEEIKEKPVTILMTPFYNRLHEGFFSTYFNTGKMKILNNTVCVPVKRADGYIQQAWMHVKVSPWVELGISYITLIRPSRSTARILLITKHGHIDGMSKDFAEEMNIKQRFNKMDNNKKASLSIFNFCPEFRPINDAFNIVAENIVLNNSSIPTAVSEAVSVSISGVVPKVDRNSSFDASYTQTSAIMDRSLLLQGDTSRMTERPLINPKSGESTQKSFSRGRSFYESAGKNLNSGFASQEFKFDDLNNNNSQVENNGGIQGIVERFSKGGKLVFYPKDSLSGNKTVLTYRGPDFRSKAVAYNVQVINKVYGKDMIKVVFLEKNTESNDETGAELNSSDPENTLPSSNQITIEYADDRKKKKLQTDDELVSPNFNHSAGVLGENNNIVGSPPKWKAREAGSLYMNSPVKAIPRSSFARNADLKQAQSESESSESEISSELTISDEVESEDHSIKKVIARSIVRGKKQNRASLMDNLTNDANSMSFCPNTDREIGGESSPKGLEALATWSPDIETRRASVNFAQHQFLKIFEERRGSSPKVPSAGLSSPNKKSRSTIFYHEEDVKQGEITGGFLKGKLQRIKARIHEAVLQHLQKAENSVTSSYMSKEKKVQHLVTQALKLESKKKSSLLYLGSFITFVLSMIVCLAIQTVNLGKGVLTVQDQTPVITATFFRQNALVYTSYLITIWKGAIEGTFSTGDWITDTQAWRIYLAPALQLLEEYDQELWGLVGEMPLEIQDRFFEKNIPIYESLESKKLLSIDSSFEAIQKIIDRETRIVNIQIPFVYTPNIDTSNFVFVLDNALNDILIASGNLIEFLMDKLNSSIDETIFNMSITLGCVLAIALAFFLITVRYLFSIYHDTERFMTLIFRISPNEGEAAQDILQRFKDALNTNMRTLELPREEKNKNENEETIQTSGMTVKYRYASMMKFGRSQRLRFLQLLPNFFTFICWSIAYYFITSEFIQNIQVSEVQMQTALKGLYRQQLITYEFIALTLNNGSSLLKNKEFLPDFVNNLNHIQDTQGLVSNFREQDGSLTSLKESLLFDFPCSGFKDYHFGELEYVYAACISLGNENMKTGLMNVNSAIYNSGTQYLQSFYESPKTSYDLAMMFLTGITGFQNLVMTAQGLLTILYESTHDSFEDRVERIKEQTIAFSLAMLFIALIITCLTWYLVLRKIFKSQNIDQKILQIIPVRLILNNKHIQQYVLRFSSGDSLNGILRFY